jgi:demethylmenaquinone methyltransferase/2-methoxy-6-polyprenyl-1,4-benzoquinol methylase
VADLSLGGSPEGVAATDRGASATAALPVGTDKRATVRAMFDTIAPRYDLVNRVMTFGLDARWRRRTLELLDLAPGTSVLDVGCGTADLARALAAAGFRAVGVDLSPGMLAAARPGGASLVRADAELLPFPDECFDGVVSAFALRNVVDLCAVLTEVSRVLRPGGRVALLEVDEPSAPLLRAGHRVYFTKVVPFIGGRLSDGAAYRYLPRSVAYLPPREELLDMLTGTGFVDVRHHPLSAGVTQVLTGTRSGLPPLRPRRPRR